MQGCKHVVEALLFGVAAGWSVNLRKRGTAGSLSLKITIDYVFFLNGG